MSEPAVILSAFADEAANRKTAVEQMSALSAIGLSFYSPRFVDVEGNGEVKHVVDLSPAEWSALRDIHDEYGMRVTSIGSRIGKVKLLDVDDGSHDKFVPMEEYLGTEVAATIRSAVAMKTKLVRGFSFYHPRGSDPAEHLDQAAAQIRQIVEACAAEGLIYGLEIEPNLVGETGELLARLAETVDHPNMVLIYDGGNVAAQNKRRDECFAEFQRTLPFLGWIHVKDYRIDPNLVWHGAVDEERLKNFVPSDEGDAGHDRIFSDLKEHLPKLTEKMQGLGVPGFFIEAEPHLKGGGQFGGFSGPDGMGVAIRAICRQLTEAGIAFNLRSFKDIERARGY